MSQNKTNLELDPERMRDLYTSLREELRAHFQDHEDPKPKEASLIYEAIDALALVTSEVWSSLHNNVSAEAAKEARRYFKERSVVYMNNLRKDKQTEFGFIKRSRRIIKQ